MGVLLGKAPSERAAVARIDPLAEEPLEGLGRDLLTGEPERSRAPTEEATGQLGLAVVVLAPVGHLGGVVAPRGGRDLHEAHHGRRTSRRQGRTTGADVSNTGLVSQ